MQISRHVLLTCAVAACLTPTLVHAADNEAQIRARQALEEKMNQLPPPGTVPTNPAPAVSKPKAAAPQSAPVESQPASSAQIHVGTPSNDPATQQKLEDALRGVQSQPKATVQQPAQTMEPMKPAVTAAPTAPPVQSQPASSAQVPATTPTTDAATQQKLEDALRAAQSQPKATVQQPAEPTQPAVTAAPTAPAVQTQPAQPVQSAPAYISTPSNDEATNKKLQEALRQKMQQAPPEPVAPPVVTQKPAPAPKANYATQPAPTAPVPAANYAPVPTTTTAHPALPETPTPQPTAPAPVAARNQPAPPTMSLPALSGPPTGLSAAKQQKLDELLNQYRADQITPQQYHEQRAKILAEP